MSARPSRLAEWLLNRLLHRDDRDTVLGDLAEEFQQRAETDGASAARRWYRRQVWLSARHRIRTGFSGVGDAPLFSGVGRDVRDACRSLVAARTFTGVSLLVLTLGIGASATVFSVVDAVVLRDMPFNDSRALVVVSQFKSKPNNRPSSFAAQDYADFASEQDVFDGLAAWTGFERLPVREGSAETAVVTPVTANLFQVLQAAPRIGHLFSRENEQDGADGVVIVSDAFWRGHLGADPAAVGRTLTLGGRPFEVAGVMPAGFSFPVDFGRTDMWKPLVVPASDRVRSATGYHSSISLQVIGRLKRGVTIDQARARLAGINAALAEQYPSWYRNRSTTARGLRETVVGADTRSWMLMLLAAVTFVLLIACVNVASLMLARASTRAREMGVRAALGASRWQLIRTVLIESLVLTAAGTACGVLATYSLIGAVRATLPRNLPRAAEIGVNGRVLVAAILASAATGLICGILPALQAARPNLSRALRDGGRSASASLSRQRMRATLVTAEVALAIVMLIGSGLFMASFVRLTSIDLGFDYRRVLTVGIMRGSDLPTAAARQAMAARMTSIVNDALPVIRALPGVQDAAALSGTRPLEGGHDRTNVVVPGRPNDFQSSEDAVDVYRVTPTYTSVLGVPLIRGRLFSAAEGASDSPVVVLNEVAAARFFAGLEPVGQAIRVEGDRTVVGVVHNVRAGGPETDVRPEVYLPFAGSENPNAYVVIKTRDDPAAAAGDVKTAIRSVAPGLPLADVQTLEQFFSRLVATRRFNMLLIGLFGALALAIASVGIYGVMAFVVEQRTSEIGLRMALGAARGSVIGLVLRRAAGIVGAGLLIGLAAAWPLARTVSAFLFQVQPHDIVVYAAASLILLGAGLLAAFGPARRASRVDPVIAIREL